MKSNDAKYDFCIIGGGFFGAYLAKYLGANNFKVAIIEKEPSIMQRSSKNNQARVHRGYHYPRSIKTAARSNLNAPVFEDEFSFAVIKPTPCLYAVSRVLSKVTNKQFLKFCKTLNLPITDVSSKYNNLFNHNFISAVYETEELLFDSNLIQKSLEEDIYNSRNISLYTKSNILDIAYSGGSFNINTDNGLRVCAKQIFNCTYSALNKINKLLGLKIIPLKHELAEIVRVKHSEELSSVALTVMCGPFFSTLPIPGTNLHSLTHVRYTPHLETNQSTEEKMVENWHVGRKSNFPLMIKDSSRYVPTMNEATYVESIFETKTILPKNEINDGRPILFKKNYGLKGYHCILGAKIDNIYEIITAVQKEIL